MGQLQKPVPNGQKLLNHYRNNSCNWPSRAANICKINFHTNYMVNAWGPTVVDLICKLVSITHNLRTIWSQPPQHLTTTTWYFRGYCFQRFSYEASDASFRKSSIFGRRARRNQETHCTTWTKQLAMQYFESPLSPQTIYALAWTLVHSLWQLSLFFFLYKYNYWGAI